MLGGLAVLGQASCDKFPWTGFLRQAQDEQNGLGGRTNKGILLEVIRTN